MNDPQSLLQEAQTFFSRYNSVFDSGDMHAFSKMFVEPFVSIRADGTVVNMPTNQVPEEFFKQALLAWQAEGYQTFATRDYEVMPIGSASMLVTLTWELQDGDQQPIREWRQSYNLLRQNKQWKVVTSTFHRQ